MKFQSYFNFLVVSKDHHDNILAVNSYYKINASFSKLSQSNVKVYLYIFIKIKALFSKVKQINIRANFNKNSMQKC